MKGFDYLELRRSLALARYQELYDTHSSCITVLSRQRKAWHFEIAPCFSHSPLENFFFFFLMLQEMNLPVNDVTKSVFSEYEQLGSTQWTGRKEFLKKKGLRL